MNSGLMGIDIFQSSKKRSKRNEGKEKENATKA